jgi:hypothetical protein
MAITALPTPPNRNMTPEQFIAAADAFLEALPQFQEEANAAAEAMNLNDTSGTSSTSNSIGTGAKTFTANTGKSWLPGMFIVIADTAAPSTNSMIAQVTSYNSGTGALVVYSWGFLGSGTKTAWTISQTTNPTPLNNSVATATIQNEAVTSDKIAGSLLAGINDFRLTLTSGTPVTTSDVTGATTIYCCPYKGKRIALYDGTRWNLRTSAEFSLALGTLTSGRPYDVFCYDNAGTPTLEFLSWTNDTTRATALTYQDGIPVKSGATTRRYLGTFYTTSTTTTSDAGTMDGTNGRYLWNYYYRVVRHMERYDPTATWTYTTATFRQANNAAANQLNYVVGVAEDAVEATVLASASNSSASTYIQVGVGVDSTTTPSGPVGRSQQASNGVIQQVTTSYRGIPGVGRHSLVWLELSVATGTQTWNGTNSPLKSGIIGKVMA